MINAIMTKGQRHDWVYHITQISPEGESKRLATMRVKRHDLTAWSLEIESDVLTSTHELYLPYGLPEAELKQHIVRCLCGGVRMHGLVLKNYENELS